MNRTADIKLKRRFMLWSIFGRRQDGLKKYIV